MTDSKMDSKDEKDFLTGTCPINPDDLDSCEACQ
jgi:hypothetical protein